MPELICSADDPRWLAERRKGITATDITAILGLSPYQSPYGLWHEKTSLDAPARVDSDRLRLGRELEPLIIDRWSEEHEEHISHRTNSLWRSSERPWQLATLDARREYPHQNEPVEVKSWADANRTAWDNGPPPAVRAQVLWQMDVMGVGTGHVGVLFLPSGEFRSYVIEHDGRDPWSDPNHGEGCGICPDQYFMRDQARDFRVRVDCGAPPDVDGSAATLAALRARFERHPDKMMPVPADLMDAWVEARGQRAHYESKMRAVEAKLRVKLGEASVGTVDDIPVIRRVTADAKVPAHVRHQDYLKLIPRRETDDE